jgi:hypothetical protein
MSKQRLFWFTALLVGALALFSACSSVSSPQTPSASPTVSASERVYILNGSTQSSDQQIIGFYPGSTTPSTVQLPAGLIALNHQTIYTATPQQGQTLITVTTTQTGTRVRSFTIPGTYSTAGQNYTTAVLSGDGHWLALRQQGQTNGESVFALVDTQAGKLAKTITLAGDFDLDAVSPDGSRLYLLQQLSNSGGRYYVRLYWVQQNQLDQNIIADKEDINDPRMIGSALTRQMSSDGTIAYTLYIDTAHNIAFVHILPLASQYIAARCIDLPAGKAASLLKYYTLALSADGTTLYAANGAIGTVVAINVTDPAVFSDDIKTTVNFNPGTNGIATNATETLYNGAAISSDNTLYFVGLHGIWALDIFRDNVKSYLPQQAFTGIALSADNHTLYAVHPTNGITVLNILSGQSQQVADSPAHAPWGIAWISN